MSQLAIWLVGIALLTGCAQTTGVRPPPRDGVDTFALEARFAMKFLNPDERPESVTGRLSWQHDAGSDRVLLSNPLGIGLAEIDSTPGRATLRTGDGKFHQADNPDRLLAEVTGQPLPISRLPAWLLGRPVTDGAIERDDRARPVRLREAGWLVEYGYGDDDPDALPQQLQARGENLELRLRIDSWKTLP